jgi:hypothetical protein
MWDRLARQGKPDGIDPIGQRNKERKMIAAHPPEGSLGSRNDGPTARFYADHILAMAPGLRDSPVDGQPTIACASRPTSWPTWVGDPEREISKRPPKPSRTRPGRRYRAAGKATQAAARNPSK